MSLSNSGFNLEFERRVPKIHGFYEKINFTVSNLATYCALKDFFLIILNNRLWYISTYRFKIETF